MSAIVGIYNLDERPVNRDDVARMVDILAHRGPDGAEVWCEGAVGLGHRMLHTTPESLHEVLPLVDKTRDLAITADARIDNREELMEALGLAKATHDELSDSELILAAYVKWGNECVQHLLGDFVFVVWDARQKKLFCARDHFGVKPFYYYHAPGQFFAFATEIKALLCLPNVPRRLNELRIGEYLLRIFDNQERTFYENILRLPPAHTAIFDTQDVRFERYWSLDPTREIRFDSDEEYAAELRKIFTEAVRCRLRSASPVGSTLSGGLDSSSIAAVAQQLLAEKGQTPLDTFSNAFERITECDELPYVNEVLRTGDYKPHYIAADQLGPLSDIEKVLWHTDEPTGAPGLCFTWDLYRTVNANGTRVLLNGSGGDETISHGDERFDELAGKKQWLEYYRQWHAMAQQNPAVPSATRMLLRNWLGLLLRRQPFQLGFRVWFRLQRLRQSRRQTEIVPVWRANLNPDFAGRLRLVDHYRKYLTSHRKAGKSARELHYETITGGLQSLALETLDKTAAAHGMELRYPFWDKRLVEFCLALPVEQKFDQGFNRIVLRRSMEGILPPKVQWRPDKTDFTPRAADGILRYNRNEVDALIKNDLRVLGKYANLRVVRDLCRRYVAHEKNRRPMDTQDIIHVSTLYVWLQQQCSESLAET